MFDSHAHIYDERFDEDINEVIKRAKSEGMNYIMIPADDFSCFDKIINLIDKNDMLYGAIGIHPHESKTLNENNFNTIKKYLSHKKIKAVGEIGLDYHYDFSDRNIQRKWFREQLVLAKELNYPVIIHEREAAKDVFDILCEVNSFETGVLMHCYGGSYEMAKEYIKRGAKISIGGIVTFKNARRVVEVAEKIDLEHLFIETDSPYLTPVPFRGKRNEPLYVKYVAEKIANIKNIPLDEVISVTEENAMKYFKVGKYEGV